MVGATLLLIAASVVHYGLVGLSLLPRNAITVLYPEPVDRYLQPFFVQNWHMFAPSPPLINETFLIQLYVQAKPGGEGRLSEWFDVSTPLRARMWSNPISPAMTRARTIEGVMGQYRNFVLVKTNDPKSPPSELAIDAVRRFNRLLAVLAAELYDPSLYRLVAIRGRVVIEEIPPFSELQSVDEGAKELKAITFDWFDPHSGAPPSPIARSHAGPESVVRAENTAAFPDAEVPPRAGR